MKINNKTIIKDDNPLIREKSVDVPLPLCAEDRQLLEDMITYVDRSTNEEWATAEDLRPAVGISAIQVGIAKKMLVAMLKDEDGNIIYQYALVNPKILANSVEKAYLKAGEGCLSVPKDHPGYVERSRRIKVRAYDLFQDKIVEIRASGYLAIVLQHELDHLKGVLYYDHIKKDPFQVSEGAYCIE